MIKTTWHRFDIRGIKYVCMTDIDKSPEPRIQDGYTIWRRGKGPIDLHVSDKLHKKVKKHGKSKKNIQTKKQKMDAH